MTAIEDRVTAVLRAHEWSPDEPFEGFGQCECDAHWFRWDEWAAHVSAAVVAELQPALGEIWTITAVTHHDDGWVTLSMRNKLSGSTRTENYPAETMFNRVVQPGEKAE